MEHEPQKLKIKFKFKTHTLNDGIVHSSESDEKISGDSSVFKQQGNNINDSNSKVRCSECFKEFSSSQALGGHMRIHAQSHKKKDDQNLLKPSDPTVFKKQENVFDVKELVCCVCGKTFGSMKSLFGHMRSHPGRQWPLSNELDNADDVVTNNDNGCGNKEAAVMGLGLNLGTWSKKARRGGMGTRGGSGDGGATGISSGSKEEEVEEKKLRNAVMDLLMLKDLDSFQATTSPCVTNTCREIVLYEPMNALEESNEKDKDNKKRRTSVEKEDDSPKSMLTTIQVISTSTDYGSEKDYYPIEDYGVLERGTILLLEYFDGNESDGWKAELALTNETNNKCFDEENYKKKKSKLMVMNSTEYKCSRCDKCFTSHQALGGHVSSHNKLKKKNNSIIYQYHHDQAALSSAVPLHCESVHACKICNKTFSSGQALGGHMRCHWPGPVVEFTEELPSTNQAQLAPVPREEVEQNPGSKRQALLEFDLNEFPPVEEDV